MIRTLVLVCLRRLLAADPGDQSPGDGGSSSAGADRRAATGQKEAPCSSHRQYLPSP